MIAPGPSPSATEAGRRFAEGRKLAFIVTEDWFFVSHFLPMARAAMAAGFDVAVITRTQDQAARIEKIGCRVIPFSFDRGSLDPRRLTADAAGLARILRAERPDIIHAIALRSVLAGGAAARMAGIDRRVLAVTGLGYIGIRPGLAGRLMRNGIGKAIRALGGRRTVYLLENSDDAAALKLGRGARIAIVGGAGIDPDHFPVSPLPALPTPLRVGIVARMLWSKGVDVAVEAVGRARAAGAAIELHVYGAPDPDNPRSINAATLAEWATRDGIHIHGRTSDVAAVWAQQHLACVPSRGGEGLPRALLEAAASGRGIVASDVPGCRSFVRNGSEGALVPADDPAALCQALTHFAGNPDAVAAAGQAARARIFAGFTEQDVQGKVGSIYRELLKA